MSSNAAKKGRELLKAARSQATLSSSTKDDRESNETNIIENIQLLSHNDSQEVIDNLEKHDCQVKEIPNSNCIKNNLTSKLAMFNTQNKLTEKPIIPKSLPKENLLLNRMNKDKDKEKSTTISNSNEPLKIMGMLRPDNTKLSQIATKLDEHENNDKKIQDLQEKNQEIPHSSFIPAPSKTDQEKLMKRITSAKGMAKGLTKPKGCLTQKTSERIMGMASMLQNKMVNPVVDAKNNLENQPKKKFLLEDDDIQRIDDEKKPDYPENIKKNEFQENFQKRDNFFSQLNQNILSKNSSYNCNNLSTGINISNNQVSGKSMEEILLEKPFNKNIRKMTKRNFQLPDNFGSEK